jgi:polysaccharide export outer membrane protein
MKAFRPQSPRGRPGAALFRSILLMVGAASFRAASAAAQNPLVPPNQAQQTLQRAVERNPGLADVIRQRLQQSGLTAEQIRERLQASGYPPSLLDAYLGTAQPGEQALTPGVQELAAVQALGLQPTAVQLEGPSLDTGVVTPPPAPVETPARTRATVFGVEVFRRTTTQFLPLLAGPVPPDYRLGPGDQLVLILTGDVELAYSLQVTREGFILVPQVGQIFVSNLTLEQMRDLLYTRLGRVYSGVRRGPNATTRFDISVANVRANQIYVVGEVNQPGAYQISALGTVLTGLYAAGGVTERASTRSVDVRRNGKSVTTFDLYDYLLHGDTRSDIRLETGDVLFVPVHGTRVTATGAVKRPAIYELKPDESLVDLMRAAGGFRADAALTRISIRRIVPPGERTEGTPPRAVIDVRLLGSSDTSVGALVPRLPLNDGDSVIVDALSEAQRNFVDIRGNVYLPGRYGIEAGMKLSQLIRRAGGMRPATFAGRAHIERLNVADSTRFVIPVVLPADTTKPYDDDPELREYDIVTIYGRPEMRDDIYVVISGMVNRPGRYPWREGMTLRDLMLVARGPRIGADLREAEVARLPLDRSHGQLANTLRVSLDSTYLFDRDSLGRYVGPPGLPFSARGAPETVLQPYDNVLIFQQPDFELQRTVTINGEVKFPGTYALRSKDERLATLVERAGGLTPARIPKASSSLEV